MEGHMTMHALTLDEYFVKYILGQGQEENEQVPRAYRYIDSEGTSNGGSKNVKDALKSFHERYIFFI